MSGLCLDLIDIVISGSNCDRSAEHFW